MLKQLHVRIAKQCESGLCRLYPLPNEQGPSLNVIHGGCIGFRVRIIASMENKWLFWGIHVNVPHSMRVPILSEFV